MIARIDGDRRDAIRRNHTATHVLHWALREVLGEHVQQAGSYVGPDRLRFDFSHYEAVPPSALAEIESLANAEVISDAPVRHYETTMDHAEHRRASRSSATSTATSCGCSRRATTRPSSVAAPTSTRSGFIGPIKILGEGSIGANLRRIEAVTGAAALAHPARRGRPARAGGCVGGETRRGARPRGATSSPHLKAARQEIAARQARRG